MNKMAEGVAENAGVKIDSAEFSVSGILYKWVNFGKGWRPRWFSLRNGMLYYYKIHGHNKIHVSQDEPKGVRIIGEESQKLMKKHKNYYYSDEKRHPKVYGEIFIKISSIKASKSDEKKFYIFTGIKTLHLRAETRKDRQAWLNALHAAKQSCSSWTDSFPLPKSEEVAISTETLRKRLQEEGLSEEAIKNCEDIMKSEFSELEQRLRLLQQKNSYLIEKLRLLHAEKMELETKVVDETENHMHGGHFSSESVHEDCHGGSDSVTDEEKEIEVEVDADTDEEDDVFFDTTEGFGADALTGVESALSRSRRHVDGSDTSTGLANISYPYIERRKRLPEPKEIEKSVSLWSLIKDNIGKDLDKVCLPVYFNEPISSLQRCFEDMEYSYLLDRAYEYGKQGNHLMRILHVAAFAVSGYSSTEGRTCKPFNPLLGETYEADYPDKGLRFFF
uniref:PH domain-containing protein n=1 Tax=Araucaria cunninghamii TaxID=56994 RepID=A0A0D6QXM1_ARACU